MYIRPGKSCVVVKRPLGDYGKITYNFPRINDILPELEDKNFYKRHILLDGKKTKRKKVLKPLVLINGKSEWELPLDNVSFDNQKQKDWRKHIFHYKNLPANFWVRITGYFSYIDYIFQTVTE